MPLAITVLGCAGTWSSAESGCSGYLIDDGTTHIWVDCGPGSMHALQRHCAVADVDAIVVTHEHPDHCMELPVLRNALKYGLDIERLPLYAPRGVLHLLESLVGSRGITPSFEPRMISDRSTATIGDIRLTFSRTDHPVETLAVRAEVDTPAGPRSVVYSADTGPGWSVGALAGSALAGSTGAGIDVAVVEATLLADAVGPSEAVHRTAAFTGEDARAAGVRRLVVTHIPPTGDGEAHRAEAAAAFGGPTALAAPHERDEAE